MRSYDKRIKAGPAEYAYLLTGASGEYAECFENLAHYSFEKAVSDAGGDLGIDCEVSVMAIEGSVKETLCKLRDRARKTE